MCSYMAMFPPTLPHYFVRWLTEVGDVVYDPFSGRGTTVLEACLLGRIGLGSDASPLAWVLSSAKAQPPDASNLHRRLSELRRDYQKARTADVPDHIRLLFSKRTLAQLVWLQQELQMQRKTDRYLMAVILGVLHANARSDGTPRGLSVAMPNTFSMAPRYVSRYVKAHRLRPPDADVFDAVEDRLQVLGRPGDAYAMGRAWLQDVTQPIHWPADVGRAKLIFSSPPYLQVMKYGKLNWLRLWMLGAEPPAVDSKLFASASLPSYLSFMHSALKSLRNRVRNDGYACLVIGDVRRGDAQLNLAREVAQHSLPGTGFTLLRSISDHLPIERKVSRIWGPTRGRATKVDRILVLGGSRASKLPPAPRINWERVRTREHVDGRSYREA
jgi:site-specific DNA-methyltransferase (adenine-specific)